MIPTVRLIRSVALAAMVSMVGACAASPAASAPAIVFSGPARSMDDIDCESLLTDQELAAILGPSTAGMGRVASSCYWQADGQLVQLVFNTGPGVVDWRTEVLNEYDRFLDAGIDAWGDPGSASIAAFGPDRGLIVHGVGDTARAISLLRLALPRL